MTFANAIKVGIDNYANFRGRSSRSEYWWFWLGVVLFQLIVPGIGAVLGYSISGYSGLIIGELAGATMALLLTILPMLAVSVRRLHDTGHSGWWYFITLIPLIGPIWYLVLMLTGSDEANSYGLPTY